MQYQGRVEAPLSIDEIDALKRCVERSRRTHERLYDWDRALIDYTDDVCGMSKAQWREKLKADTETFLAERR